MRQAYLKLQAINNKDGSVIDVYIRHDVICNMHQESDGTYISKIDGSGVKVTNMVEDILIMLESPVIEMLPDHTVHIIPHKHQSGVVV